MSTLIDGVEYSDAHLQSLHNVWGLGEQWFVEANRRRMVEAARRRALRPAVTEEARRLAQTAMLGPRTLDGRILPYGRAWARLPPPPSPIGWSRFRLNDAGQLVDLGDPAPIYPLEHPLPQPINLKD